MYIYLRTDENIPASFVRKGTPFAFLQAKVLHVISVCTDILIFLKLKVLQVFVAFLIVLICQTNIVLITLIILCNCLCYVCQTPKI